MSDVLSVKNLKVTLEGQDILSNISFSVKKGEVLVIVGPNGAGKTTLLKALLGIIPSKGEVQWGTKKISYLPPQELLQRQFMPPLTVKEFFELKNAKTEDISKMLEAVGLKKSMLEKNFNHLSTGQFQRVIIAWALVNNPEVLLFDEPTSGIDIGGEETIYSLLHKFWKEKNISILLVTHELNVVWEHADNVLCLNKKKLCYGAPNKILTPKNLEKLYGTGIKFYKHGDRK
ncbi:MAG: metal ABC transporter ATP-binding protein [Nanoarchaeota archaeon]|nr:metal ABC transporter ATP-binding protein [Nanoarchaeota archaeon]